MKYALIPLLPFAAFLVIGLFGHWIKERAHWIAVPAVGFSFLLSVSTFMDIANGEPIRLTLYSWITSGAFDVNIGFYIDRLTAAMLLLVTIVSGLVHVYTIGYMRGEPGYARFFAYIALFTFSMLMLVMADNFLQLYVFWEAVGLCSYLLIGHWYDRKSACDAATKAFVVNRVGDFGFGLGIMLVFVTFGSLQYDAVFGHAVLAQGQTINLLKPLGGEWLAGTLTVICLLLFTGAVGKSAQVPLHVWLPDAMEGPTPISALIHAATMVTAGVFMVARLSPLYNLAPAAMDVVAVTGGVTAIFAATIALTQNDIKRVVAYSTVSQLGYMMMACGLGAYTAGMYHLLTHGAFKALLFLGCGSVIIALHHEQDMRRMGGLKDKLPVTYWTMVIGSLALAGIPGFSGFFSKEEILAGAWGAGPLGQTLAVVGLVTAFMTAFYSFRLIFVAFWGESRVGSGGASAGPHPAGIDPHHADHIHEPSPTMTAPLLVLAVLSVFAGYFGIPHFIEPVLQGPTGVEAHEGPLLLKLIAIAMGVGGIAAAYVVYVKSPGLPQQLAEKWTQAYALSLNKWYVDELYDRTIVTPTVDLANGLWRRVDVAVIDAMVNGVGAAALLWGRALRLVQSGQVQHYALAMALGTVVILGMYLWF
ncbi:MAG: NADH-quinone oxidoreductase subunit L [Nitrospirae bacterium]|nr:MAG: NADH-quinone oxidoreductase subunit L [Nitrospirota bacterium]